MLSGHTIWAYHLVMPLRYTIWVNYLGVPSGCTIWVYHLGIPSAITIRTELQLWTYTVLQEIPSQIYYLLT